MQMIIAGEDCDECRNSVINDEDKARVKVYCTIKEKSYYWGQCIPCELKEAKKQDNE
jgi:hypothetical protein